MDKTTLKSWFARGKKPTAAQFAEWIDSFWHKNEKLAISNVENLSTALNDKQDKLTFDSTPIAGSTNPVTSGGVKAALVLEASERTTADEELQTAVDNLLLYPNNNPILSKNDNVLILLDSNNDEVVKITTSGISLEKDCTFENLTGTSDSVIKTNVLKSVDDFALIQVTEDITSYNGFNRPLILAHANANAVYGINGPLIIATESIVQYYGANGILMAIHDATTSDPSVAYNGLNGNTLIENDAAGIYYRGVNNTLLISSQYDQASYRGFSDTLLINSNSNNVYYFGWNGKDLIRTYNGAVDYVNCDGNTLLESRPNSVALYSASGNKILDVIPTEFTLSADSGNEIIYANDSDFHLRDFDQQDVIDRDSDRLLIKDKQGTEAISFYNDLDGLTISGIYEEVSMLQGMISRTTPSVPYDFISLKRGTLSDEGAPETIVQTDNLDISISSSARIDGVAYERCKIPIIRTRRVGVNYPNCELIIGNNLNSEGSRFSDDFRTTIKGTDDIRLVVAGKSLTINAAALQTLATSLNVTLQDVTRDSMDFIEEV